MLAENGIIGLLGYLLTFGAIIWTNIKNYFINKNPHNLMIIGSTIALFLQGLTEYNFGNSSVMKIYWLVLSCLVVLVKEYNEEKLRE
jgi:O-antigen ligase